MSATSDINFDAMPPSEAAAEVAIVGAVLLAPSAMHDLVGLKAHHFFDDANRLLFDTLAKMHEAGCKLDVTLIVSELKRLGRYESVGGSAYIAKVANSVPSASHAAYYAAIVRESWAQRSLRDGSLAIASRAWSQNSKETKAELSSLAESIDTEEATVQLKTMQDACLEVAEQINRGDEPAVKTGLFKLDNFTKGGLKANQLTILAAATSVGKSAFAIEIADNAAHAGARVLYVTLEMTGEEIIKERLLPRHRYQSSRSTSQILSDLSALPITFVDRPNLTVANIRGFARLVAARGGLDLLIIDHIGCMSEVGANAYARATELSRKLMALPKELGIPVLALSQINRENSKTKTDKMAPPRLDQLRDSGALEQDAHNVWLLHRETRLDTAAKLFVAKQRNGSIGQLALNFDLDCQRFTEVSTGTEWKP